MNDINMNLKKEFDIKPHIQRLHQNRIFIMLTILLCIVIGIVYYFLAERNYQVRAVVLPTTNTTGSSLGGLGGLASIAGVNLSSNAKASTISVDLYPQIVNSTEFLRRLAEAKVNVQATSEPITYSEFLLNYHKPPALNLLKKYTIGLPSLIFNALSGGDDKSTKSSYPQVQTLSTEPHLKKLTKEEMAVISKLANSIKLEINQKFGSVEISVEMQEAELSAQMAREMLELLQTRVHEFKTQKALEELSFLQERYSFKRKEYDSIQSELAKYRDENLVISTAQGRTKLEWLENEFSLHASVLQELAKNLETQELELSKQSPSFAVIQPVIVPLNPVKESKVLIFFISIVIGVCVSVGYIYLKEEYLYFKGLLKNNLKS